MSKKPISIVLAKDQLERIDSVLESPILLIGGIAVNQYWIARDSVDLDILCDSATSRRIVERLYPSEDWTVTDLNNDEYRPSIVIKSKFDFAAPLIRLGPKIEERTPYKFLPWEILKEGARSFSTRGRSLANVLVPQVEALAYSKAISFAGRSENQSAKIRQDLVDFCHLTNQDEFRLGVFYNIIRRVGAEDYLRDNFSTRISLYEATFSSSYLTKIAAIFRFDQGGNSKARIRSDSKELTEAATVLSDLTLPTGASVQLEIMSKLESRAKVVKSFGGSIIPGLLQSLDYATLILASHGSREPRAAAHERIRRQLAIVESGGVMVWLLVHEHALSQVRKNLELQADDYGAPICPIEAQIATVDRITHLVKRNLARVRIRVVSADTRLPVVINEAYTIYDETVEIEPIGMALMFKERKLCQRYFNHFDSLWQEGKDGDNALLVLESSRNRLRKLLTTHENC